MDDENGATVQLNEQETEAYWSLFNSFNREDWSLFNNSAERDGNIARDLIDVLQNVRPNARSIFRFLRDYFQGDLSLFNAQYCNPILIKGLIQYSSACAAKIDEKGRFLLHYACQLRLKFSVIQCLVEAFPGACSWCDCDRRLPLHYVLRYCSRPCEDTVRLLLHEYPDGARLKFDDNLPLHMCSNPEDPVGTLLLD